MLRTLALLVPLLLGGPAVAADPPAAAPAPEVVMVKAGALAALLKEPAPAPRIFNFWATWCGPCVAELPVLRDFAAAHPEVEVVLVNVDVPALHARKVVPFVDQHGLEGLRNVQLDDPDPARALARVVPGWPDAIPVTAVNQPDGTRAAFFPRAVTATDLEQAVAAAR